MPPKAKDTWTHCDMIDGKMICKYCQKFVAGGGIYRFKQHLVGIGGHVGENLGLVINSNSLPDKCL